jgi:hypothetical protein
VYYNVIFFGCHNDPGQDSVMFLKVFFDIRIVAASGN